MTWYNHITLAPGLTESSRNYQSGRIFGKSGAGSKVSGSLTASPSARRGRRS